MKPLRSVMPSRGRLEGGTPLEVTGEGFSAEGMVMFVGKMPVVEHKYVSSTLVRCRTPPGTAGTVDVEVLDRVFGRSNSRLPFLFEVAATVSGISPTKGSIAGGTVTVLGVNFINCATLSCFLSNSTDTVFSATFLRFPAVWRSESESLCPAPSSTKTSFIKYKIRTSFMKYKNLCF